MTQIFKCIAGSRLYGTNNAYSDTDFKAVHLPTKRDILLGERAVVKSTSTGNDTNRNGADDIDIESFELQRFLKLASDMQTIPVEMLFVGPMTSYSAQTVKDYPTVTSDMWVQIILNRNKIISNNPTSFIGYCKGQAVRYSMRGDRLKAYVDVTKVLAFNAGTTNLNSKIKKVGDIIGSLSQIDGVKIIEKNHNGKIVEYLDVYGRQVPENVTCAEAYNVYIRPVNEAGKRAQGAMEAGGADLKALYHSVRIADQGIALFRDGNIEFPCQNRAYLMKIRAGEVGLEAILDHFDEKLAILLEIGDNSPLASKPDYEWMEAFVLEEYEKIVRA